MPDDMEQIEARLAAYVDGTLPVEQRAEIEAYLKANPTHGRLITELKSIKFAVSTLPKEKAPAEILDTLQGHLERHTLLEGVEETAVSSRIRRWPQVGALAAVLLLTAGLGILVYQVLPQKKGPSPELALLPDSTQSAAADDQGIGGVSLNDGADAALQRRSLLDGQTERNDVSNSPNALKDEARRSRAMAKAAPGAQMYQNQFSGNPQQMAEQGAAADRAAGDQKLDIAGGGVLALPMPHAPTTSPTAFDGPVRVLRITTDDPIITRALTASYFAQSRLPFERMQSADLAQLVQRAEDERHKPAGAANLPALTASMAAGDEESLIQSPGPGDVIVVRQLPPQKLADVETALMTQRPTRQRTQSGWLNDHFAAIIAPTSRPSTTLPAEAQMDMAFTAPKPPFPKKADDNVGGGASAALLPSTPAPSTPAAPSTQPTTGATTEPSSNMASANRAYDSTDTVLLPMQKAMEIPASNLVIIVVAKPAATQPTTLPAVEVPTLPLPTTVPATGPSFAP